MPLFRFLSSREFYFIVRAFRYRNYRLFFMGQGISLVGTWMQSMSMSWLIYRLTNSPFLLGLVYFIGQIPVFILTPIAGVLADRVSRKEIIVVTQSLSMVQAFILAALSLSGKIAVWHIIILSFLLGIVNAFDVPVRQAFVADLIEKKSDLGNAIALNSLIFNGARVIGPSIAGVLIMLVGEGFCFLLNGISFCAVLFALILIKIKKRSCIHKHHRLFYNMKEGFSYVVSSPPIRIILVLISVISVFGVFYPVIMPVFSLKILKGGAQTLGFLMGGTGFGAFAGALFLASRSGPCGLEKIIPRAMIIFGISIIAFSLSRIFWLSLVLMIFAGFGMMVQIAASNTVLQSITDDDKRGRVMSFYTIAFMGMVPLGSLLAGALTGKIGGTYTLILSGLTCLIGSAVFFKKIHLIQEAITGKIMHEEYPLYEKDGS